MQNILGLKLSGLQKKKIPFKVHESFVTTCNPVNEDHFAQYLAGIEHVTPCPMLQAAF